MSTITGARQGNLPIWRDANRLLVEVEQAVRRFGKTPSPPRYHKYALGTDLRKQAMVVCRCVVRAAAAQSDGRERWLERLVLAQKRPGQGTARSYARGPKGRRLNVCRHHCAPIPPAQRRMARCGYANSAAATLGMRQRWAAASGFVAAVAISRQEKS